jgi:ubiquinone biosynthesis protein UbiJ
VPGSRVHISGDANLARDMEQVFRKLDPDWEGQLSTMLGDVLGFQVASGLRQGAEFLRESARKTSEMAGSYLRDESQLLVRPSEFSAFSEQLRNLEGALDELEKRLRAAGNRSG